MASKNITTRVVDINNFRSIVSYMDDTTDWLSSVGESQKVFDDMMVDGRIESLVKNRKDRVLQMTGSIGETGNKTVDDACRKYIDFNLLYKLNLILLNAIAYGIALCEVIWERRDGLYVPAAFTPIPRTAINFPRYQGEYGTPYLVTQNIPLSDPDHFIIHRSDVGDGNVWGTPALRGAYWPWRFKRLGFKFWMMAAERIGVPSILALFETRNEAEARARASELVSMLGSMESGSSGAFGNVKDVRVVESRIQDFNTIIDTCNTEIAYALTGQSLATNEAQYGTRAQASVHEITYSSSTTGDAYLLQVTDQSLYNSFVRINFPGAEVPKFDIDSADYASWDVVRDAIDRGIPVSLSAIYDKNHVPKPTDESDVFVKQTADFQFSDDFFFRSPGRKA